MPALRARPPTNATGGTTGLPLLMLPLKFRATASQSPRRIWGGVAPFCWAWIMSDLAKTEQRPAMRAAEGAIKATPPTSSTR